MQKDNSVRNDKYIFTQNRELSWLHFNQRVLEEASDTALPELERLKFVSIFSSNLDEFFMVRVGSLFDLSEACPDDIDRRSGMTPEQQLDRIYEEIPSLINLKRNIYLNIKKDLLKYDIEDLTYDELDENEKKYVGQYYKTNILPVISPIIIGSHHPVPHLDNKRLYIAAFLKSRQNKNSIGLIPIPDILPAFITLSQKGSLRYIRIENIILHWASKLFGSYKMIECVTAAVTRNADISFDDDKFEDINADFRSRVTSLLKSRNNLNVIRMELNSEISDKFKDYLVKIVCVNKKYVYVDSCPLKMDYVFSLIDFLDDRQKAELLYTPYKPKWPEDLNKNASIMSQIQKNDKMLFFPYDSTEPFIQLLSEAAEAKNVVSIKITIYRLASSSKIARLLCRAAENGKQVIVLMELRARFDEANNIQWSKVLENSGCQIIYGIEDFKCHSKICQITYKSKGKLHYITQIGTGNYNEKTNTMYTDLSLMTSSQAIGEDATTFFHNLLVNNLQGEYKELLVSPEGIENSVNTLIDNEIKKKDNGYICIKVNSLTDYELIEKLVEASQAGVKTDLIVRGICCLIPEIPGYTDNIRVTSIVGRFLEHARIYCFGKGDNAKLYISSADFMERNLHHRVEIACPVHSPEIRYELRCILSEQLSDNVKASNITDSGTYRRKKHLTEIPYDSQEHFLTGTIHKKDNTTFRKATLLEKTLGFFHHGH